MKLLSLLVVTLLPSALWAFDIKRFDTHYVDLQQHEQRMLGVREDGSSQLLSLNQGELIAVDFALDDSPMRPADILSDGRVVYGKGEIRKSWLGGPSDRYRHGVMADDIEATRIYTELATQQTVQLELPVHLVFEDRFPRLTDLDDDGEAELILIRTDINSGAGIAVYGFNEGELVLEAASETIGKVNRWLNIVGIEDFNGDGVREIAAVITPHIGGTLTLFEQRGNKLAPIASQAGYSNHEYGARELGMSAVLDINGDGVKDMAVPDAQRRDLIFITARNNQLRQIDKINNRSSIESGIYVTQLDADAPLELIYLLKDSTLKVIDF